MTFGDRLKDLRLGKGLTQAQLGRLINKTKANISKYEHNIHEPDMQTMEYFTKYFNCSADYLYCKTDSRQGVIVSMEQLPKQLQFQEFKLAEAVGGDITDEEIAELLRFYEYIRSKRRE